MTESLEPLRANEINATNREDPLYGRIERSELDVRQLVDEPLVRTVPSSASKALGSTSPPCYEQLARSADLAAPRRHAPEWMRVG